jgi:osmotically inducible protein OsmC
MKIIRYASATWTGPQPSGVGSMTLGRDGLKVSYSLKSRTEDGFGTNPEELVGAALAGCFSMSVTNLIDEAGQSAGEVTTTAKVTLAPGGTGYSITEIHLVARGTNQSISNDEFVALATRAKETCPVSRLYASAVITLDAALA